MTDLICRQLWEVFIMFYCGLAVMFVFETRNRLLKTWRLNRRIRSVAYMFSWVCASYLFYTFLYKCSYGRLSVHSVVAALMGILLWKKMLYGIIDTGKNYEKENKGESQSL